MDNLNMPMTNKFIVTIHFNMDDDFMTMVPPHRIYVNSLIEKSIIEYYAVSMETQRCWILVNADSKKSVKEILQKSPIYKYWEFEIDELFVYDSQTYRLPALQLN